MKAYNLKQYIIDNGKIVDILEWLECHHIKSYTKRYSCALPNGENPTAVSVKKDNLKTNIYSKSKEMAGDIFSLVMDIKNITFPQALREIHKLLGLKYINVIENKVEKRKDILEVFKKAKKRHKDYSIEELQIYNEDICREFIPIPYIEWVREGIMPFTQKEFGIGYSRVSNRVCIPWRFWCGNNNQYTGIVGRTLNENYKELGIPKYFPLIAFPKSMNMYGLQENYKYIQESGFVNVFESEKSTLKRHSKMDKTGVSLGCHNISDEQVSILLSLDVDIIIQMDKDITLDYVRSLCEKFYLYRTVYYVFDEFNLLKEKESPADKNNKIYWTLWNRKIKYDDKEHEKYLEWSKSNG